MLISRIAATGLLAAIGMAPAADPAAAASVFCRVGMQHSVCTASFAQFPPGSLRRSAQVNGTASFQGRRVRFTCWGGNPRRCDY